MNLQLTLQDEFVKLEPLKATDFEKLYTLACDPLIWEQHPNKDRYKREVFNVFFKGAMESNGAYIIYDAKTNVPIGGSRFYDLDTKKVRSLLAIHSSHVRIGAVRITGPQKRS
jgi:hypothetical protein